MIMKKFALLLFTLSLACSGCVTLKPATTVTLYDDNVWFTPTDAKVVKVFYKKPENTRFVEIGEITVEDARNMEEAKQALKERAAELGGNAVYIVNVVVTQDMLPNPYDPTFGPVPFRDRHHYYYRPAFSDFHYYDQILNLMTVTGVAIRYL
jgi:hypothetical protein